MKGLKYQQHPKTNKLTYGVATCFYTLSENREFALKRLSTLLANVANAAPVKQNNISAISNQVHNIERDEDDERKLSYNVIQRFKNDDWITGKLGENVLYFIKT